MIAHNIFNDIRTKFHLTTDEYDSLHTSLIICQQAKSSYLQDLSERAFSSVQAFFSPRIPAVLQAHCFPSQTLEELSSRSQVLSLFLVNYLVTFVGGPILLDLHLWQEEHFDDICLDEIIERACHGDGETFPMPPQDMVSSLLTKELSVFTAELKAFKTFFDEGGCISPSTPIYELLKKMENIITTTEVAFKLARLNANPRDDLYALLQNLRRIHHHFAGFAKINYGKGSINS